jgi:spermidine synthase
VAAISLIYFISAKKHVVRGGIAAGVIIALIFLPFDYSFAFWEDDILYEDESIYNYLRVEETTEDIILSTNVLEGVQSIYKKSGGLTGMYYDYALAAPLMAGEKNDAMKLLVLGMGTGTYAKQCEIYYPGITSEGVEIDRKIVNLSRKYFDLPEEIPVICEDGRAYLRNAGSYDIIMVDAYQDITIPFQMSTVEFFTMVREHLNPGGVMVVNMNMRSEEEGGINDCLIDTICSVFPSVATVTVGNNTNRELFAGMNEDLFETFRDRVADLDQDPELMDQLSVVLQGLRIEEGGEHILTDDRAPVEILGMQALDTLISDTLEAYGGVEGLL